MENMKELFNDKKIKTRRQIIRILKPIDEIDDTNGSYDQSKLLEFI